MASVLIRTVIIYIVLSLSIKIMGKRQIGELETGELITTLLISEVASLPIDDPDIPLAGAIFPILLIISVEILVSFIKNKSERLKRIVDGEPVFIIYKGRLKQHTLHKNRISINEILSELRVMGIGDICDVEYAILEQNGKLSVLKRGDSSMAHSLIIDGEVKTDTVKALGYNDAWLKKQLSARGYRASEIFLMTVDDSGNINVVRGEK